LERGIAVRRTNAWGCLSTLSVSDLPIASSEAIATLGGASPLWTSVPYATPMRLAVARLYAYIQILYQLLVCAQSCLALMQTLSSWERPKVASIVS
jgi:hypothetical protein